MGFIKKRFAMVSVLIAFIMTFMSSTTAIAAENSSFNQNIKNVIQGNETSQTQNAVQTSNVRLQDDFYGAINGKWLKTAQANINPLLKEDSCFSELQEKNDSELKEIVNDLVSSKTHYDADSDERKMSNLYNNTLNLEERNKQGVEPIKQYLNKIENVKSVAQLTDLLSDKDMDIFNMLVRFSVQTTKDEKSYELDILPTYLGLGTSDEYTNPTEAGKNDREKYIKYLYNLLTLSGYDKDETVSKIESLITFEKTIAPSILGYDEASKTNDLDMSKYNIPVTVDELNNKAPNLNLPSIMKKLGVDKANNLVLQQDKWLTKMNELWTDSNLPMLKNYLEMIVLESTSMFLTEDLSNTSRDYTKYLTGENSTDSSLQDDAYELVNNKFVLKMGKLYVDKYFSEKDKEDVQDLTSEVISTYKKRISNSDWISDMAKKNAIDKLDKITVSIGYPDYYDSNFNAYSDAEVKSYEDGGSLLSNVMNLTVLSRAREIQALNESVDKKMFSSKLSPQSLTAEYHFNNNSLIITAGILQPDFYNRNKTKEQKLATVGFIIAHEVGHAFDNTGMLYDGDGNRNNWWTADDYKKFNERTDGIINFYNNIEGMPGKNVNGINTLGENIADLSSMRCLLDILQTMPNANYKQFFESYAEGYRCARTPEYEQYMLEYDTHSPYKVRVNDVLAQYDEFYKTYGIKEGDKMYIKPENRVGIWR